MSIPHSADRLVGTRCGISANALPTSPRFSPHPDPAQIHAMPCADCHWDCVSRADAAVSNPAAYPLHCSQVTDRQLHRRHANDRASSHMAMVYRRNASATPCSQAGFVNSRTRVRGVDQCGNLPLAVPPAHVPPVPTGSRNISSCCSDNAQSAQSPTRTRNVLTNPCVIGCPPSMIF